MQSITLIALGLAALGALTISALAWGFASTELGQREFHGLLGPISKKHSQIRFVVRACFCLDTAANERGEVDAMDLDDFHYYLEQVQPAGEKRFWLSRVLRWALSG